MKTPIEFIDVRYELYSTDRNAARPGTGDACGLSNAVQLPEQNTWTAMKWFDRSFSFDLDLDLFPNLIERLRGTPARLEEITSGMSPTTLTRRLSGAWSIQENVGHLADLEPLWLGRVEDFAAGIDVLRPADLTNRQTNEAAHNERKLHDVLHQFRTARLRLVDRLEKADDAFRSAEALHPRLLQPMRVIDLVFFVAEHDDHHLARISALSRESP